MGWTKRQLIEKAFAEIGLAVNVFNVSPEQLLQALNSLDAMVARWNGKGIRLGYALPSSPDDSDIDSESGLPDFAIEAVFLNLAIRIGPGFGKTATLEQKMSARDGYEVLLSRAAFPPQQQLPNTLPRGAGNKPWRGPGPPIVRTPTDPLVGADGGDEITYE
jgi:hypothetical protein